MSLKDSLLAFVIVTIWGFNFIVIAWGVEHMPPLMMGAGRFLFVGVIGCLFVKRPNIPLRWLALYALTLCFGQFALLFCAIAFGMPAGLASLGAAITSTFHHYFVGTSAKRSDKTSAITGNAGGWGWAYSDWSE